MKNSCLPDVEPSSTGQKRGRFPIGEEEVQLTDDDHPKDDEYAPPIKTIAEKELAHKHQIENSKIKIAIGLLAVCFAVIIGFAIGDATHEIESSLFSGAFEFAKTIATAAIGYLFAANAKDK